MADDGMQMMLARLSNEEASDDGGGGATTTASTGNIFDVLTAEISGIGEASTSGIGGALNWDSILAKDIKSLLDEASDTLCWVFGNIKISAGSLLPTIDYFQNARNIQFINFLQAKPHTLFHFS